MPRPLGRTTKLTPELHQAIVNAVSAGVSLVEAAQFAGVGRSTVLEWLDRGTGQGRRQGTEVYIAFYAAVQKALAADTVRRVARIEQAGRGGAVIYRKTTTHKDGSTSVEERLAQPDWAADAWHLERSKPDQWGRKDRVDLKVTIQQAAQKVADALGLTVDEVLAEAQALLAEADDARS